MNKIELDYSILDDITSTARIVRRSELDSGAIEKARPQLEKIKNYLSVTDNQAIVFVVLFVLCFRNSTADLGDIASFLMLDEIDCISLKPELDTLFQQNLIVRDDDYRRKSPRMDYSNINIKVNPVVSESIFDNISLSEKKSEKLDVFGFVGKVSKFIQQRAEDSIDTIELFKFVSALEKQCDHLEVIQNNLMKLKIEDRTLLYEVIDNHIANFPSSADKILKDIFNNNRVRLIKYREISERTSSLFELELMTLSDSRFLNDVNLLLTEKTINLIFSDDAELFLSKKKTRNIIFNKDIVEKELFFDAELENEMTFLLESLQNENFQNLQNRMSQMSLSKGVAAILFGSPGTGKTESVFQLAKKTGRDVIKVDISQSKSMWFGESEKRVKEIFDSYNRIAKSAEKKPILLFNEADALFSKRKENTQSSTSNTENAIQNIILDEMERFEGIMIATTNLQGNLDSAYERRFLFKVKFDNPSAKIKAKIWQSKLNWMQPEFASSVAKEYSFSGGEIDNIVRKITMKEVITGIRPDENAILQFCKEEKLMSTKSRNYIGFTY